MNMKSSFYQLNIWYARWTSNYFFNGNILQIKNISQTMSLCYWRDICLFLTVLLPFICLLFYYVNNIDAHPTLSWRQPCVRLDFSSVGVFLYFRLIFFMLCSVQPKLVFKLKVKLEHYVQVNQWFTVGSWNIINDERSEELISHEPTINAID